MANSKLELILAANTQALRQGLQEGVQAAQQASKDMQQAFALGEAKAAIGELGGKIIDMGRQSVDAASNVSAIRRNLSTVIQDGAELDRTVSMVRELSTQCRLSGAELGNVVKAMKVLGPVSEENLKAVLDIAAGTNESAETVGRMMQLAARGEEGAGRALMALAKNAGATASQLEKLGAVMQNGEIFTGTVEAGEKFNQALVRLSQNKWPDAAKKMLSASEELQKKQEELQADIGRTAQKLEAEGTRAIIHMVEALQSLPDELKQLVGLGELGAGKLIQMGQNAAQLGANLGIIAMAMPALKASVVGTWAGIGASFTAAAAPFIALAAVAAGTGYAIAQATMGPLKSAEELKDEWSRLEKQMKTAGDAAAALGQANHEKWASKSAEDLSKLGVTSREVELAFYALDDKRRRLAGFALTDQAKAEVAEYQKQCDALAAARDNLAAYEKEHPKVQKSVESTTRALEELRHQLDTGHGSRSDLMQGMAEQLDELRKQYEEMKRGDKESPEVFTQRRLEALKRVREAEKSFYQEGRSLQQDWVKGMEAQAQAAVEASNLEVEALKQTLTARQIAGQQTLADRQKVVDAQLEAAKKERDATLRSINDQQQAAMNQPGGLTGSQAQAFADQRANAEKNYTNKVKELANQRVQNEKDAQNEIRQIIQERINASLTAQQDYEQKVARFRSWGMDAGREDHQNVLNQIKNRINAENTAYEEAKSRIGDGVDADKKRAALKAQHEANIQHIQAEGNQKLYEADQRERAFLQGTLNIEKQGLQTRLDGIELEIQALESKRDHGIKVEDDLASAYKRQAEARIALIHKQRDADLSTELDPRRRRAIEANAAEEELKTRQELSLTLQRNHEAEMSRLSAEIGRRKEVLSLQQQAASDEIARIRDQMAAGHLVLNGQQMIAAKMKDQAQLAMQIAKLEADIATANAANLSPAEQALVQAQNKLKLDHAQVEAAKQYQDALEAQDKILQDMLRRKEQQEKRGNSPMHGIDEEGFLGRGPRFGGIGDISDEDIARRRLQLREEAMQKTRPAAGARGDALPPGTVGGGAGGTGTVDHTGTVTLNVKASMDDIGRQVQAAVQEAVQQIRVSMLNSSLDARSNPYYRVPHPRDWSA